MERNYYSEGFENFLKEKSDEYKLYPSEKVWNNINQKLHPRRKWPYLAAALLLLGIGVGTKIMIDDWNSPVSSSLENKSLPADKYEERNKSPKAPITEPAVDVNSKMIRPNLPAADLKVVRAAETSIINNNLMQADGLSASILKVVPFVSSESTEKMEAKVVPFSTTKPLAEKITEEKTDQKKVNPISNTLEIIISGIGKVKKKTSWQMYVAPTVSYRKLVGHATKSNYSYSGFAYSANLGFPADVNDAVTHIPSVGIELGTAFIYPLAKNFRIKAGLQFNLNNYQVEAYSYIPEIAPYGAGNFTQPINTVSYYRNFNGYDKTWLRNSHFMVSIPLGVELAVIGNKRVAFNIASTIQPTYVINNNAYLVSTNLKNYAQEPSLYRKWNIHAGGEAFMSINTGSVNWVLGPQIRYQILSSYKEKYPIKEHLIDFGFKVGVTKTLK
ncbi:MAG: hypothetical protein ACRC2O_02015 [Chitinophagaceae bacterium]